MTKPTGMPDISSYEDLLAVAYQIEADAVERYQMLTEQMEVHNNLELAKIFSSLARAEAIHRDEILNMASENFDIIEHARKVAKWRVESPEEADLAQAHYLMTPWHALQLSLGAETRARDFFQTIVQTTTIPEIKRMAEEFAREEEEHVELVHRLLSKYPKPSDSWADDPDPPNYQE